jgi:hypothetical protein
MTRRSRSQALVIWQQIANGILFEPGRGAPGEIPTKEYYDAIDFLTQVASEVIQADDCSSQKRSKAMLNALQLEGKKTPDETALRKTSEILDDFANQRKNVSVERRAALVRYFISNTPLPDGRKRSGEDKTDSALIRQLQGLDTKIIKT